MPNDSNFWKQWGWFLRQFMGKYRMMMIIDHDWMYLRTWTDPFVTWNSQNDPRWTSRARDDLSTVNSNGSTTSKCLCCRCPVTTSHMLSEFKTRWQLAGDLEHGFYCPYFSIIYGIIPPIEYFSSWLLHHQPDPWSLNQWPFESRTAAGTSAQTIVTPISRCPMVLSMTYPLVN